MSKKRYSDADIQRYLDGWKPYECAEGSLCEIIEQLRAERDEARSIAEQFRGYLSGVSTSRHVAYTRERFPWEQEEKPKA